MRAIGLLWVSFNTLTAFGSIIVDVSSYSVTAGTPVVAQLTVSNSVDAAASDIEGMTFTVQLADGTGNAPKITSVDLLSGTIWAGHVSPGSIATPSGGDELQFQSRDLLTDNPGDYVDANGLLATVTFDTTGAAAGDYAIQLVGTMTPGSDSAFLDGLGNSLTTTFGEGNITITVPEPSGIALGLVGALALAILVRFPRRSNESKFVRRE